MKLHKNQLNLIRHLIRFNILSYEDCLSFLDTENSGDMIAMSYAFRPLTKNGYVVKNRDGVVAVLQKGRKLFPDEFPLISVATHGKSRLRAMQVSKVCMWMERIGIPVSGELLDTEEPYFIPSARWRDIAKQLRAESSLFYYRYGSFETKADGMIMICDDGKRNEIAKQIIRQTMWARKALLKDWYAETNKPVRYSRSPIKLRTQYEHVYLTTPKLLFDSLDLIYDEDYYIENAVKGGCRLNTPKLGDIEVYPKRYYINPAFDILKLVYFFSEVKSDIEAALHGFPSPIEIYLYVCQEDLEVAKMYPDVNEAKGVKICAYRPT